MGMRVLVFESIFELVEQIITDTKFNWKERALLIYNSILNPTHHFGTCITDNLHSIQISSFLIS